LIQAAGCFIDGQLKVVYMYNIYPPFAFGAISNTKSSRKRWYMVQNYRHNGKCPPRNGGRTAKAFDRCRRISSKAQ
jgi:hypothetical protein